MSEQESGELPATPSTGPTTARFAVLVVLVLAVAGFVFLLALPPGIVANGTALVRCYADSGVPTTYVPPRTLAEGTAMREPLARAQECMAEFMPARLTWLGAGMLVLLVATAVVYRLQLWWRIRRNRLEPLDAPAGSPLADELESLVALAGVRRAPTFLLDPYSTRAGGVAFGRAGRQYVALDAGLVATAHGRPALFRSVVLHELAHLRGNDVPITYLTMAVWRAFVLVALPVFAWGLLGPALFTGSPATWSAESVGFLLQVAAEVAVLAGVVLVSRNAVLRARERHADALVADLLGSVDYLAFARQPRRWSPRTWFGPHPTPADRLAVVADPTRLLRPGFGESLAYGIAAQLGWWQFTFAVGSAVVFTGPVASHLLNAWGLLLAGFVFAVAVRLAATPRFGVRAVLVPCLGFTAGLMIGARIGIWQTGIALPGIGESAFLALFTAGTACLVWWTAYSARLAAGQTTRTRRVWAGIAVGGTATMACTTLLFWAGSARTVASVIPDLAAPLLDRVSGLVGQAGGSSLDLLASTVVANSPVMLAADQWTVAVVVVLLCVVPLLLARPDGRAVRSGLVAAAVAVAVVVVLQVVLRVVMKSASDDLRATDGFIWIARVRQIGIILLAVLVTTLVTAARRSTAAAVVAALATSLFSALAFWALAIAGGCVSLVQLTEIRCTGPTIPYATAQVLRMVLLDGVVLAAVGIALGAALRRARAVPVPARAPGGRVALAVLTAAAVVMVVPHEQPTEPTAPATAAATTEDPSAVVAWWAGGGREAMDAIAAATTKITEAGRAEDVAAFHQACLGLADAVDAGRRVPAPPGTRAVEHWSGVLEGFGGTAAGCGDLAAGVEGGGERMTGALESALTHVEALMKLIDG